MKLHYATYSLGRGLRTIKTKTAMMLSVAGIVAGSGGMTLAIMASAHAAPLSMNGCTFDSTAGTWTLQADCTSTAEINLPSNTTLDGAGHTISAGFAKTDNSNNAVLGVISVSDVTIENLTIDGSGGTNLHGINTYISSNVNIHDVVLRNVNHTAINVNGTDVTVNRVTTVNSGWDGFDVDQGTGVTAPSVLTVAGPVDQSSDAHDIYVDNTTKQVTVNDPLSQYIYQNNVVTAGDRLYTWVGLTPSAKDGCFKDGWMQFTTRAFKNQGQCVRWVEAKAEGHLWMSGPSQQIRFHVANVTGSHHDHDDRGKMNTVEYWNYDYPGILHYNAAVTCASVSPLTDEARFMFQIPDGHPGLSGLYVVAYVKEMHGEHNPDLYGHAATSDLATATQWCRTGIGFAPSMYPVVKGNVEVE